MKKAFFDTLIDAARQDGEIFLIVADVGYGLAEPFAQEFANEFLNIGVAEQNMIGVATGLALSGKTVFCYSIPNFATLRCLEQIRNDVCYHKANVKIVSAGGGLGYGLFGMTHHGTEDLAVMRAMPNMTVICPADAMEAKLATEWAVKNHGPLYLRLTKGRDPIIHHEEPLFEVGKAITVRDGNDLTLIATGGMVYNALQAAELLAKDGIFATVLSMHTLKPLDVKAVKDAPRPVWTIEDHGIIGGLGSAVSEVTHCNRIAIENPFSQTFGDYEHLQQVHGLTPEVIYQRVKSHED